MSKVAAINYRNKLQHEIKIIETLEMLKQIAVSEFQYMDRESKKVRNFTETLEVFFGFYEAAKLKDSLFLNNPCKTPAVIAVSSDEGFFGALNNQITESVAKYCEVHPDAHVIVIGRRGVRKLKDMGINIAREFPGISLPLTYSSIIPLKNYLMEEYLARRIGRAEIIFAHCHSFNHQSLSRAKLLPFDKVGVITATEPITNFRYVEIEPDVQKIVEYTIALWFGRRLYEIFWDSKLSETACRTIEINERHQSLSRDSAKTRIRYFRASHEVIDAGIREIFASQHFAKKIQAGKNHES